MGNAIIIDGEVIWYGDINPFKENIYDDSIMRIDDEVYAKELILEVKNRVSEILGGNSENFGGQS